MKTDIIDMNNLLKGNRISLSSLTADEIGDEHLFTGINTPLLPGSFDMADDQKI